MQSNQDRLLKIQELLFTETNDERALGIQELIEKLRDIFPTMKLDPRTIRKDLEILNNNGFLITESKGKYGRILYRHEHRLFKPYEMRYILGEILTSNNISPQQKRSLAKRLAHFSGKSYRPMLEALYIDNVVDGSFDHQIIEHLDVLQEVIHENKAIELRLTHDKTKTTSFYPYGIYLVDDYYVVGKDVETDQVTHIKLVEISSIRVTNQSFEKEASFQLKDYVNQAAYVFSGEVQSIEIEFIPSLLETMLDHFPEGEVKKDGASYVLKARQRVSYKTFEWLVRANESLYLRKPEQLALYVKELQEKQNEWMKEYSH